MDRWQRSAGRTAVAAGLVAGLGWLVWRAGWSLTGAPRWSAIPVLLIEMVGWLAAAATAWALWPGTPAPRTGEFPTHRSVDDPAPARHDGAVTTVVRSDSRELPWLEATLLATGARGPVLVVDLARRADVAELAARRGAEVVTPDDPEDLNGWAAIVDACRTPFAFVLDAGDVARPDAIDVLARELADDVAVVQGRVESALGDSAEHRRPGRHENDVERLALGPALGRRGAALLTGSGSLVRLDAIRPLQPGTSSPAMAEAILTTSLLAEGWRLVAPHGPAVAAVDPHLLADDAERARASEASAARELLLGASGALRTGPLRWRARLALVTWAVRPLAGIRRSLAVALLGATLLSGRLPFDPAPRPLLLLWLPMFVLLGVGLDLLSAHTLSPGERARHGWHTLGTAWRGVLAPNGRPEVPNRVVGPAFGLDHSVAPSIAVALLSVVLGLRGYSDRVSHTLEPIPGTRMAGLLVVALWTLWGALDALRVIARRAQSRRAMRVTSSLPCTIVPDSEGLTSAGTHVGAAGGGGPGLAGAAVDVAPALAWGRGEHAGIVVDLTPLGAALISDLEAPVGSHTCVTLVLPTASGCTTARLDAEIRNARLDWTGEHRYGLRFVDPEPYVSEALAELCVIQPALDLLGVTPSGPGGAEATAGRGDDGAGALESALRAPSGSRRLGLRAAALVAIAGAVGSAVPAEASAARLGTGTTGRIAGAALDAVDTTVPSASATAIIAFGGLLAVAVVLGSLPPARDGLQRVRHAVSRPRRPTSP